MDPQVKKFALRQIEFALGTNFDPSSFNENVVLDLAIHHQCVPFLCAYFNKKKWVLPEEFKYWNRDAAARNLLYSAILVELETHFKFPWIVLKGIPLGEELYGHPSWRQSTDIDILIEWNQLDEALKDLKKIGFVQERKIRPWAYNQIALRHHKHHATIEIHWRLTLPYLPAPTTKSLLKNSRIFDCDSTGSSLHVLEPNALFFNLVMHFHQHFSFIKGAIDLAAWSALFSLEEGVEYAKSYAILELTNIAIATTKIRGWEEGDFPTLSQTEKHFLKKRVSISKVFSTPQENQFHTYWKQIQNSLYLDNQDTRTDALLKSLLLGPHRFSDFFAKK